MAARVRLSQGKADRTVPLRTAPVGGSVPWGKARSLLHAGRCWSANVPDSCRSVRPLFLCPGGPPASPSLAWVTPTWPPFLLVTSGPVAPVTAGSSREHLQSLAHRVGGLEARRVAAAVPGGRTVRAPGRGALSADARAGAGSCWLRETWHHSGSSLPTSCRTHPAVSSRPLSHSLACRLRAGALPLFTPPRDWGVSSAAGQEPLRCVSTEAADGILATSVDTGQDPGSEFGSATLQLRGFGQVPRTLHTCPLQ